MRTRQPKPAFRSQKGWHLPLVGCLVVSWVGPTPAQTQETIASDRPGIGSGSFVLNPGTVQLESGVEMSRSGDADLYSLGQLLFRIGALAGLEVQAQLNSFVVDRQGGVQEEGLQDMGVGAKVQMISDGPGGMRLSFLPTLSLPTGAESFSAEETVATISLLADVPFTSNLGLSANLGVGGLLADVEDEIRLILTPALALPTSENIGIFAGYAGFYSDGGSRHFLEAGATWIPGPDLQLDVNGGVDPESGDAFFGLGLATRWSF